MANPIKYNELIDEESLKQGFEDLIVHFKNAEKEIVSSAKKIKEATKGIKLTDKDAPAQIEKNRKATEGLRKEIDLNRKAQEQLIATENKLKIAQSNAGIEAKKVQDVIRRNNSITTQEINLNRAKQGSMVQLSSALALNRIKYRDLSEEQRNNIKVGGKLLTTIQQQDAKIKQLDTTIGNSQRKVGDYKSAFSGLKNVLLKGLGFLGVTVGITALKSVTTSSVDAFRESEKAIAQVRAGLESTGGTVGFTIEELQKQATDLQKTTLFGDDEILQGATAQLLTFTNIAGINFERTQKAALDLATRLDGDLKGASIQLGKALNDPVANLSALSKSGIQFSTSQKEVIKDLAESGRLAEAQTIILDELNIQYGGSAEAAALADGGFKQLSNAVGDLKERFGELIVKGISPVVMSLKSFVENIGINEIRNFLKVLSLVTGAFVVYKTTVFIVNNAMKAYTFITNALRVAKAALTGGIKLSTIAMKDFNTASKANIIGALVAILSTAVAAFYAFRDSAREAVEEQNRMNKAKKKAIALQREALALDKKEQESIEDRLKAINSLSKEGLNQLLTDIQERKEKLALSQKETESVTQQQLELKQLESIQQRINNQDKTLLENGETFADAQNNLNELREIAIADTKVFVEGRKGELKVFNDWIVLVQKRIALLDSEDDKKTDQKTRLEELQKLLKEQEKALEMLATENKEASDTDVIRAKVAIANTQDKIDKINKLINAEIVLQKVQSKGVDDSVKKEVIGRAETETDTLKLFQDKRQKEIDAELAKEKRIKEIRDYGVDQAIKAIEKRADAAIKAADDEIAATEKQIDRQEQLAANGLENSLKFEQEQRAKALQEKIEAEKQKAIAEKISAFWNILANSDSVMDAITKFGIGEAFSRTIASSLAFAEGGETPNKATLAMVGEEGTEYIMPAKQTKEYKPMLKAMHEGTFEKYIDNTRFMTDAIPKSDRDINLLIVEMQAMRNELKNSLPNVESYFDTSTKEVINIVRYQDRKKKTHYKMPLL